MSTDTATIKSGPSRQRDVVVIGAGLAGLTTAMALAERGLSVEVLERDDILGGRASSWTDPVTGDPIHIGPHIFLNLYPNMFKLLDALGTRDRITWQPQGRFLTVVDGEEATVIEGSRLPAPYHFVPSLLADKRVNFSDLVSNWSMVQLALACDEAMVARLDEVSALDMLRAFGVSERFIERFWYFTGMAIMNVPLEICSAGALIRFYARLVGHKNLAIGFPDGGLGDLFTGPAVDMITAAGGVVTTNAGVTELILGGPPEGVRGVVLSDGTTVQARHVVSTLPPHALRELLPEHWTARHGRFGYLDKFEPVPYVSPYLWFDRKVTDLQFWARAFEQDDLNCDFYDLSNINSGWSERPSLITSNIIYSHRAAGLSDDEVIQRTMEELAEFLPGVRDAQLVHSTVNHIPMAIHAPRPGTEQLRPNPRTSVAGFVLAGDWIRTEFPCSMESAVAAGWKAAEEVLADRGQAEDLAEPLPPSEKFPKFVRGVGKLLPNGWVERRLDRLDGQRGV